MLLSLLRILSPISRILSSKPRSTISARGLNPQMASENIRLIQEKKRVNFRLTNVSGLKTDLLEIQSHNPTLHVLFIPGNPGVVSFYTDFLESLYELLGGTASITAIGHIAHTDKNWESGRLFSLQEQINHKISFIEQELQDVKVPIILVGHSIGAYIALEIFKRSKVIYCIGLYPFLAVNTASSTQSFIKRISAYSSRQIQLATVESFLFFRSRAICVSISSLGAFLGMLPPKISRFLVKKSMGKSWSSYAVEILSTHVLQYHTLQNVLFMAMTEFQTLPEKPDWDFIRTKKRQVAFLFGDDDHWGPLHLYEEICKQVPNVCVEVEREGHTHAFSCSESGSIWVAQRVSSLINNNTHNMKGI